MPFFDPLSITFGHIATKHSQPCFLSNCSLTFCSRSFLVTGTTMLGRVHTRIFRSMTNSTAKTANNARKIEPDFVKIPVLISLDTAQYSSHLIFFQKSAPDFWKSSDLNFVPLHQKSGPEFQKIRFDFPWSFGGFCCSVFTHFCNTVTALAESVQYSCYASYVDLEVPNVAVFIARKRTWAWAYLLTGLGDAYGRIGIQFHSGWRVAAVYLNNHERFPGLKQLSLTELTDLWWSVLLLGVRGLVKCFPSLLLAVPQSAHVDPKEYQLTATGIHRLFTSKHCLQFTSKHCSRKTVAEPAGRTHDQLYQLRHNLIVEQSSFYFFPAQLANSPNISAKWHAVLLWQSASNNYESCLQGSHCQDPTCTRWCFPCPLSRCIAQSYGWAFQRVSGITAVSEWSIEYSISLIWCIWRIIDPQRQEPPCSEGQLLSDKDIFAGNRCWQIESRFSGKIIGLVYQPDRSGSLQLMMSYFESIIYLLQSLQS